MIQRRRADALKNQSGVALPMAMMALVVMTTLIVAFVVMSSSEPTIANNQLRVAQARAIAEAGMERAIWALNNPADPNGIPDPLILAPAPYNGVPLVNVAYNGTNIGGFRVTVANGGALNERNITVDGWVPNDTANTKGKQRITVTVSKIRFLDPPAGLAVRGEIAASGHSLVDSRADTSCGNKGGTWSGGATIIGGSATIYGADGNNVANQPTDAVQNLPQASFDPFTYSNAELDMIKALAKANGTYYQGTVTFNSSNTMPNGIVYVDTVSGNDIDAGGAGTTPTSDFANVTIHGNAPADPSGIFSGWLIVAGSLSISGNFQMHGLVYVLNDLTYTGTGTGQIDGAVITQNVRDVTATTIDSNLGGNAAINFNCNYAKTGGGQVPQTYRIKAGTYKEVSG